MHFSEGEYLFCRPERQLAYAGRCHADIGMPCFPCEDGQILTCMDRLWLCSSVIGGVWSRGSILGWKAESLRGLAGLSETSSSSLLHSAVMYSILSLLTAGSPSSLMRSMCFGNCMVQYFDS